MRTLRSMMHGRLRTDWRRQQSKRMAMLEDLRTTQQYKRLFRHIGIKPRTAMSLHSLATADSLLTTPTDIHAALTRHFAEWYSTPTDQHPFARHLHDPAWIQHLLHGTATPTATLPSTFCQDAFFHACRRRVTPEQQRSLHTTIGAPLQWHEYDAEIHLLMNGKAPGPSGVTATMIKAWPPETHSSVFDCLASIWSHRHVPNWWLHSYLHPIPKKGAATLENLRPLGLYEILRKILAAIIIKRAYRQWECLHLLHPHQHAYRRGMGTGTAILRLLNIIEEASETGQPLLVTAWDIRRAFDSIPHPFIHLALARLGIPPDVADWFLHLLTRNIVTVQSPHAQQQACIPPTTDPAAFIDNPHCSDTTASFHQQQGIGQGDTPSAIFWVALYDILLCMLDVAPSTTSGHFIARSSANMAYPAGNISYADDLCTPAGHLHLSQHHAHIVSTFCAATTLSIATHKVLAFAVNATAHQTLTLHDWSWTPHIVPFCDTGIAMTYLGLDSAHQNGYATARQHTTITIRSGTTALQHRQATPQCKLDVIVKQLYPKALYPSTKACWSLHEYQQLDRAHSSFLRHAYRLMHSSALDMLHFPATHGGTGLNKLSDLAQTQKWGELRRALNTTGEASWAAHGLLERAMRQLECIMPPSMQRSFPQHNHQHLKCYAGSLIEWGATVDCALTVTPATSHTLSHEPITPYLHPVQHSDLLRTLQRCDIAVQGELCTTRHDGTPRWHNDTFTTTLRRTLGEHAIPHATLDSLHLATGQMYYILPSARFLEIHSVLHSSATNILLVREWHTIPGKPGHLAPPINPPPPLLHQPYTPLASQQWHRLITEPARSTNGTHARRLILCTTMCPTPCPAAPLRTRLHPTIQQFIADLTRLQHSTGHQYTLFTDGAYACNELPLAAILQSEFERRQHSCAAAAIVAIGPPAHWRSLPILALALTPSAESLTGSSSYTTELLALAIATISCHAVQHPTLPPLSIYSDCQAAIATTLAACTPLAKQRQHGKIHVITDCLQGYPPPRITWTRSHPERRSPDTTKWSYNDWGIHIADAIAGQHDALALLPTMTIHQHNLDCTTAIQSLLPPATWHWTHHNEQRPMLCSPLELVQLQRVHMYLHTRDTKWRASTLPPRWQGTSLTLRQRMAFPRP